MAATTMNQLPVIYASYRQRQINASQVPPSSGWRVKWVRGLSDADVELIDEESGWKVRRSGCRRADNCRWPPSWDPQTLI
jgi:hypothetical protein